MPKPGLSASILFLTYNQVDFVQEAFQSLLRQNRDDVEVIAIDDCSCDGTWERLQDLASAYRGCKQLILRRNESNLGIVGNLLVAAREASSNLFVIAHGDDVSLPDRCSRCIEYWQSHGGRHDLVAADAFDMSMNGEVVGVKQLDDLQDWTVERWFDQVPFVLGASQMITRDLLYWQPLDIRLRNEDHCLSFRAVLRASAIRLPEPLILHRRGGDSQARARTAAAKRSSLLCHARAGVLALEQIRRDALFCGCWEKIRRGFETYEKKERYIVDMLAGKLGIVSRVRRCLVAGIPWSKRLRFLAWSFRGEAESVSA